MEFYKIAAIAFTITVSLIVAVASLILSGPKHEPVGQARASHSSIDPVLHHTATLIMRFYRARGISVIPQTATRNYMASQIICKVPPDILTAQFKKTAADLEHYLVALGIDINPGSLNLTISGTMVITFTHKETKPIFLTTLMRKERPYNDSFVLGITMDGNTARLPMNRDATPHLLIVGTTGSGKTYAAIVLIINAIMLGWDIYVFNPKARPKAFNDIGLWDTRGKSGVCYTEDPEEMIHYARTISMSMASVSVPTIIVVDEVADIIEQLGEQIAGPLGTIAQKGREYDVHLILLTPKATKSVLENDMLHANISTAMLGMKMNSGSLSQWGTGVSGLHLDKLAGKGHAKLKLGADITELQVAIPNNLRRLPSTGVISSARMDVLPEVQAWFQAIEPGQQVSKNDLRRHLSANGNGMNYAAIKQQFEILQDQGRIERAGNNVKGVKVK